MATQTVGTNTIRYYYDATDKTVLKRVLENGVNKYFAYDSMGNMTTYKGSGTTSLQNLYWTRGNMLSHGTVKTGKEFSYKYGPDNLRYSKTVNNVETLYYWDGDLLVGEKTGTDYIIYLYDATGVAGMVSNGAYYYFEKNLFGDILRVYNDNEVEVAQFTYDSYGNILSQTGSMADKVKMRYRGYYWDEETGFYYLQSRYYDPSICRFISADQYSLLSTLSSSLGELNLYAYCGNNPVMYSDETGYSAMPWWGKLLIGIGVVVLGAVVTALTAGTGTGFMAAFGSALLTSAKAVAISTTISASIGFTMGGLTTGTWEGAFNGLINGAIDGFMWGGIFAGGAQIVSAGFKGIATIANKFGKLKTLKKSPFFSPDRLKSAKEITSILRKGESFYDYGGTLVRFGRFAHIDVSTKSLLHLAIFGFKHIPIGTVGAGIIGGF